MVFQGKTINMKRLITMIVLTLAALSAVAQQAVTGRVTDAATGRPIEGVNIRVEHTLTGATTNGRGEFRISDVASDGVLKLSHVSYVNRTVPLEGRTDIEIALEPSYANVGQVVVTATGTHRRQSDAPVAVTVLTQKDLTDAGVTTLEGALLKLDPSFGMTPLGSMGNTMTMNGLEDTYILFMVNGHRMIGSGSGSPDLSRIDLANVKRIEILDGAASMLYGSDAIAGVVNIITDDARSGVELSSQMSLRDHGRYEHSVNLDAKEGKLGSYTSFVHQQSDSWQLNPEEEDKTGALVPSTKVASYGYESNTVSQRFTYDLAPGLSLYAEGSYYGYEQQRPETIGGENTSYNYNMRHTNYTYGAGAKYIVNPDISLYADFYSDNYRSEYLYFRASGDVRPGDAETRVLTRFYQGSLRGIFNIGRAHKLSAGAEYLTDRLDDYLSSSSTLAEPVSNYTFSVYAQDEIRLHRKWQAVVGVRYLYHERVGSHATPNLALMYKTGPWRLRASFATGYKTPTLSDLYTFNVSKEGALTISNENLKPEKSIFGSFNAEYATSRVTLSATAFYNRLHDKIEVESFDVDEEQLAHYQSLYGEDVTSSVVKKRTNIDKARVAGVTLTAKAYLGAGFTLQGAYNFVDGCNLSAEEGTDDRLDKNIRHAGNVAAQWTHAWGRYNLNVMFNGQIRGKRFSSTYSPRIGDAPSYSLWDLTTTHTFNLGRVVLVPTIGVENLFDYVDDRPGYLYYETAAGKGASTMSPYATLTPGRTYFFSLSIRFRSK